jgi:hypothetical protein
MFRASERGTDRRGGLGLPATTRRVSAPENRQQALPPLKARSTVHVVNPWSPELDAGDQSSHAQGISPEGTEEPK